MALQLKITLDGSYPKIWRRVIVPDQFTFYDLHLVIQAAMGWDNCHLFSFGLKGNRHENISIPSKEDFIFGNRTTKDARKVKISEVLDREFQKRINYEYDFGDSWGHTILLEKITDEKIISPRCIKGAGACPPEDCGGIWGYYHLLEVLGDKKHPEHGDTRDLYGLEKGDKWDPEDFDLPFYDGLVRAYKKMENDF